jgi:hypothetical protein
MSKFLTIGAFLMASVARAGVVWNRPTPVSGSNNIRLDYDQSGLTNGECGQGQETTTRGNPVIIWKVKDGKAVKGGLQLAWTYQYDLKQNFTVDLLTFTKEKGEDQTARPTQVPGEIPPTAPPPKPPRVTKTSVYKMDAPTGTTGETDTIYRNLTSGVDTCRPASRKYTKNCMLRMIMKSQPEGNVDSRATVSCSNVYILSSNDDVTVNVVIKLGERDSAPMLPSSFKSRFLNLNQKYSKMGYTENNVWVVADSRANGDHYADKPTEKFSASGGTYTVKLIVGDQYGARGINNQIIANNSEELGLFLTTDAADFREAMGLNQEGGSRLVTITYGGKSAMNGAGSTPANLACLSLILAAALLLRKD